jgi:RimJ/RimL family protein N-acetyltransferase
MRLETNRLIIRPFEERDCEPFAAYRGDPLVAEYQGWQMPYTLDLAVAFVAEMKASEPAIPGEWYQLAFELKEGGAMIGDCAFQCSMDDPRQALIGFSLARPYQRQGYALEGVSRLLDYLYRDLNLHRVQAECDVENLSSAKLLERLGMRREAHFVDSLWFKGRWASEYWYGLLQREWLARHP